MNTRTLRYLTLAAAVAAPLLAQQPDVHLQKTLAAGSTVNVQNLSGDVHVIAGSGTTVEINGYKHGSRRDFDEITLQVVDSPDGITVCPMLRNRDMECTATGLRVHDHDDDYDGDLDIDIEVRLPKSMRVSAHSVSGDVSVSAAEGDVRAGSVSGDVAMDHLRATAVHAASVSGDIDVGIDALTGSGDLTFKSVSGNVTVTLPQGLDADVEMRSVSGELDTDFPMTLNGRMDRHSLGARIGRGGRALEVTTVSGDVRLRSQR